MTRRQVLCKETPGGRIELWLEEDRLSLWFDDTILQSEISLHDPAVLPNPANRAMLAHLMFGQSPRHILLGGAGGGAIGRWFHARLPGARGDAVELNPEVARIAREYFDFPPPGSRWEMHEQDIRDFIRDSDTAYDFILLDLEEAQYSPAWLTTPEFLRACRERLSGDGVLTLNLIPRDADHYAAALATIRRVFDRLTLCLPVAGHDNQLILAFRQPPAAGAVEAGLPEAAARWGIDFRPCWESIRRHNPPGSGIL